MVEYGLRVELTITDDTESDRRVLCLTGAVDLLSREQLLDQAAKAIADHPAGVVIDLSGVDFFDSTAIGALVRIAEQAEDAGISFALRNPSARVARVLQIAGLEDTWDIEHT